MENLELGKEKVALSPVFLYKVNMALALFLVFINLQSLISNIMHGFLYPWSIFMVVGFLIASIIYGIIAANGFFSCLYVYEKGIRIKSLFSQIYIPEESIKSIEIIRLSIKKDTIRRKVLLMTDEGKPITIKTAKYQNPLPLMVYLRSLEQGGVSYKD